MATTHVVTCLFFFISLLQATESKNNASNVPKNEFVGTRLPGGVRETIVHKHDSKTSLRRDHLFALDHSKRPHIAKPYFHNVLFAGCGYCGTGFLSRVYGDAGYPIGHECEDTLGRSDWRHSFRNDSHNLYRYIFVTVRHPLSVVNSCRGTGWGFEIEFEYDRNLCVNANLTSHPSVDASAPHYTTADRLRVVDFVPSNVRSVWNHLPRDVKTLEWWYQATTRALRKGHFWFQIETFNEHTAVRVCRLLHLDSCEKHDWAYIIDSRRGYNRHNPTTMNATSLDELQASVACDGTMCDVIAAIFERATVLCLELGYSHC